MITTFLILLIAVFFLAVLFVIPPWFQNLVRAGYFLYCW